MKIIAVDFSITSPAITLVDEEGNVEFICFDEKNAGLKQKLNDKHSITVLSLKTHKNDLVRFDMLQDKITEQIREDFIKDAYVGFEGYSFGASGQITRIAEACAILKYKLYSMGCNEDLIILAPSTVK